MLNKWVAAVKPHIVLALFVPVNSLLSLFNVWSFEFIEVFELNTVVVEANLAWDALDLGK